MVDGQLEATRKASAAVDTISDDLVLTQDADIKRYDELYDRLRDAAMPTTDSLKFLINTANTFGQP